MDLVHRINELTLASAQVSFDFLTGQHEARFEAIFDV